MTKLQTIFNNIFKSGNTLKDLRKRIKSIEKGVDSLQKEANDKFKKYMHENPNSPIEKVKDIFNDQKKSLDEIYLKELNELKESFGDSKIDAKGKKQLRELYEKIDKEIKSIDRLLSSKTKHLKNSEPEKNDFGLTTKSIFKVTASDNFDEVRINTFNKENNTFKPLVKNTTPNNQQTRSKQI